MGSYALNHPNGYYVAEAGNTRVLHRPDGTEVEHFDSALVWDCEITLAAFKDHSEWLAEDQATLRIPARGIRLLG